MGEDKSMVNMNKKCFKIKQHCDPFTFKVGRLSKHALEYICVNVLQIWTYIYPEGDLSNLSLHHASMNYGMVQKFCPIKQYPKNNTVSNIIRAKNFALNFMVIIKLHCRYMQVNLGLDSRLSVYTSTYTCTLANFINYVI